MRLARVGLCAIAIVVTACSSNGSGKPSANGTAGTTGSGVVTTTPSKSPVVVGEAACRLITRADATAIFGTPAAPRPDTSASVAGHSTCFWSAHPNARLEYGLQVRVYDGPEFYRGDAKPFRPLAGIGDKAAIYPVPGGALILVTYEKGRQVVTVSLRVNDSHAGVRKTAAARRREFVALVKRAARG